MSTTATASNTNNFARHSQQEQNRQNAAATSTPTNSQPLGSMSLRARFLVFLFLPTATGLIGLVFSYLQTLGPPVEGKEPHKVDFDKDFLTPFLLSMALVLVVGFQTSGFRTRERTSFIQWPKTRKIRTVRRERVIVEDEDVVVDEDDGGEDADENKKDK